MEKNQFSCSEKELPKLIAAAAHELKPFGFEFVQFDDGFGTLLPSFSAEFSAKLQST